MGEDFDSFRSLKSASPGALVGSIIMLMDELAKCPENKKISESIIKEWNDQNCGEVELSKSDSKIIDNAHRSGLYFNDFVEIESESGNSELLRCDSFGRLITSPSCDLPKKKKKKKVKIVKRIKIVNNYITKNITINDSVVSRSDIGSEKPRESNGKN